MYLWVVLATFLAMIAGYYLPLRHDTHDIVNVPVAQTSLIQMIAQHKIARKWLVGESYPMTCYCVAGSCSGAGATIGDFCGIPPHKSCTCTDSSMTTEQKGKFPYPSGQALSEEMMQPYAPFGFIYNANYVTTLYCSTDGTSYSVGAAGSCDTNLSSAEGFTNRSRLLITTGPIPERWRNYDSEGNFTPSIDFMNAMHTEFFTGDKAGYAVNATTIINQENGTFSIPSGGPQTQVQNCLDTYENTCLVQMSVM